MLPLEANADTYKHTRLDYHATVRDLPTNERPRERLQHFGPQALSLAELLAIILRTGTRGDNALELANKLLARYGGLPGLVRADFRELCAQHGMGEAKSAQVKAALEIGRRLGTLQVDARYKITTPAEAANLVMLDLAYLDTEHSGIQVPNSIPTFQSRWFWLQPPSSAEAISSLAPFHEACLRWSFCWQCARGKKEHCSVSWRRRSRFCGHHFSLTSSRCLSPWAGTDFFIPYDRLRREQSMCFPFLWYIIHAEWSLCGHHLLLHRYCRDNIIDQPFLQESNGALMIIHREPVALFLSYAHEDERWLRKLETHLSLLQRQGLISLWHDRCITPGIDWAKAIDTHLETASVILLLVSADFLASDYCYGVEMKHALQRQETGEAQVIPILLRSVDWKGAPFAHLQALPTDAKPITAWSDEDEALTDVAAGIRRVIEILPLLAANAPSAALPAIWNIPYPRNPFFTGREAVLNQLHEHFMRAKTATNTHPAAITGLGGIGKTQIAIEYAYRYAQEYQTVFWLHASSYEVLASDIAAIPTVLNLPERNVAEQFKRIEAVKKWLTHMTRWLLIFDDANELEIIRDFLSPKCFGHIIVTTRSSATGKLAQAIQVKEMQLGEATSFLLHRSKAIETEMLGTEVSEEKFAQAKQIGVLLGCLPLALEQAGAYIEETGCSLGGYITAYKAEGMLLRQKPKLPEKEYPHTVATTWLVSFEKVRQANPIAGELLSFFAFLAPDAIPEELVTEAALQLGPVLGTLANNPLALDDAMAQLRKYSLVQRHEDTKTCSIHRLVQEVMQDAMTEEEKQMWEERVMAAVHHVFPKVHDAAYDTAPLREREDMLRRCQRYLPQALVCVHLLEHWDIPPAEIVILLQHVARYLNEQAQYGHAELLFRQAAAILEKGLGAEDPAVARILMEAARMCMKQVKYDEAELLYQRAGTMLMTEQGMQNNTITILYLAGLGELYTQQNRFAEAELPLQQAIETIQKEVGAESDDYTLHGTLIPLSLLTILYMHQGKYEEAEALYKKMIALGEKLLGSDADILASWYANLAHLYIKKGENYAEAEALLESALSITLQHFDEEHPDVAAIYSNLGRLYFMQEKLERAEEVYRQSLSINEKIFGKEHPALTENLRALAEVYLVQKNKLDEALPLLEREVLLRQKVSKKSDMDLVMSLYFLGQGHHVALNADVLLLEDVLIHFEEAEKYYRKALEILETLDTLDHSWLATIQDAFEQLIEDRSAFEQLIEDRPNYIEEL